MDPQPAYSSHWLGPPSVPGTADCAGGVGESVPGIQRTGWIDLLLAELGERSGGSLIHVHGPGDSEVGLEDCGEAELGEGPRDT